jgi:hypothetical protein
VAGDPFEIDEAARRALLDEVDDPLRTTGAVVDDVPSPVAGGCEQVMGYSALETGLAYLPLTAILVIASAAGPALVPRLETFPEDVRTWTDRICQDGPHVR